MNEAVQNNPDVTGLETLQVIARAGHFNKWMYQTIQPFLKGEILEIGSGIGNISTFVVNEGLTITLSDYDWGYCTILKNEFGHKPNVKEIISIDLQHPEFRQVYSVFKAQFDTVFLLNVLEHLQNDQAAINNCRFMLKDKGRLIILVPAYQFLYCRLDRELGHYRRYTLKQLQLVFEKENFQIIQRQYFNFFGLFGWLVFGKLLKKKSIGSGEMTTYNKLVPAFRVIDRMLFNKAGLSAIIVGQKYS